MTTSFITVAAVLRRTKDKVAGRAPLYYTGHDQKVWTAGFNACADAFYEQALQEAREVIRQEREQKEGTPR